MSDNNNNICVMTSASLGPKLHVEVITLIQNEVTMLSEKACKPLSNGFFRFQQDTKQDVSRHLYSAICTLMVPDDLGKLRQIWTVSCMCEVA